jgi:hypothetical protein
MISPFQTIVGLPHVMPLDCYTSLLPEEINPVHLAWRISVLGKGAGMNLQAESKLLTRRMQKIKR